MTRRHVAVTPAHGTVGTRRTRVDEMLEDAISANAFEGPRAERRTLASAQPNPRDGPTGSRALRATLGGPLACFSTAVGAAGDEPELDEQDGGTHADGDERDPGTRLLRPLGM